LFVGGAPGEVNPNHVVDLETKIPEQSEKEVAVVIVKEKGDSMTMTKVQDKLKSLKIGSLKPFLLGSRPESSRDFKVDVSPPNESAPEVVNPAEIPKSSRNKLPVGRSGSSGDLNLSLPSRSGPSENLKQQLNSVLMDSAQPGGIHKPLPHAPNRPGIREHTWSPTGSDKPMDVSKPLSSHSNVRLTHQK